MQAKRATLQRKDGAPKDDHMRAAIDLNGKGKGEIARKQEALRPRRPGANKTMEGGKKNSH